MKSPHTILKGLSAYAPRRVQGVVVAKEKQHYILTELQVSCKIVSIGQSQNTARPLQRAATPRAWKGAETWTKKNGGGTTET